MSIRFPEVAGGFYPANPQDALNALKAAFANTHDPEIKNPKVLVLPHAGWNFCLSIMAEGLRAIHANRAKFKKVVLIGPAHRVAFKGIATTSNGAWKTPFGDVGVDIATLNTLIRAKKVNVADHCFAKEHSLEVILPAIQKIIPEFQLIPLLVGEASETELDSLIEAVWGGQETLIIVSSDLSHFHTSQAASEIDKNTRINIETYKHIAIGSKEACGHRALNAVLRACEKRDFRLTALDVRHSGLITGDNSRVVGYGAFVGEPAIYAQLPQADRQHLINTAIQALDMASQMGKMPNFKIDGYLKPHFAAMRATFVTLKCEGKLRGCIGSLIPHRSLLLDVATNAVKAGFQDPRFKPMTKEELANATIDVSILSHPQTISFKNEADLLRQIRPDVDGLILRDGNKSGLFLPSVWESYPKAQDFFTGLKRKAGLPDSHWSNTLTVQRYTAEKFSGEYLEAEFRKAA